MFGRCTVFLHKFLYWNCISTLWRSRLECQDFKTTDPHLGIFSFSLPLKASGLNELEHKWANNSHTLSTDTTHVYAHICKFISPGFSITLASIWPVLEPLNFHWLQKGKVSGPLGTLKSQGTSDTPRPGWISNIRLQHTTNTAPREILHKAIELWYVDFKSTSPSYCSWKQLGHGIKTIRSNLGLAQMAAISSVLHRVSLFVLELNLACDLSLTCQRLNSFPQAPNMSSLSFPWSTVKETTEPYR